MTFRFKADGVTGTVAVYDYTTADDDPFDDPTNHIDRLQFHSDLPAVSVASVSTGSITLGTRSANTNDMWDPPHVLFAHGRSGIPYVEGIIWYDSAPSVIYPLVGTVPIQTSTSHFARLITLGADATNVVLHEQWASHVSTSLGSIDLSYEIYVTDLDCTGVYPPSYADDDLLLSPTRCVMGKGKFDTNRRYFRGAASGGTFPLVKSETWDAEPETSSSHNLLYIWSVGTLSYDGSGTNLSLSPAYTMVKI
jgi:hypothetical protein